jgi:transcriptional regulator with PAS, ATPase and Fis domain
VNSFIGQSESTRVLKELATRAGEATVPVLVFGETGTGKEIVARGIHRVRGQGPFVPIDCGALAAGVAESELFGHVRGAFTGAFSTRVGLLESAKGGTAFLDEVGELSLETQSKLLRAVQQKELRSVGTSEVRKADFRTISATNRYLPDEVKRGSFRQDLYYRLGVIVIPLLPLRERLDDIPLLVDHFCRLHAGGRSVSRRMIRLFCDYDWPGNVRELENCIMRLAVLCDQPEMDLEPLLSDHWRPVRRPLAVISLAPADSRPTPWTARQAGTDELDLVNVERRAIQRALEASRGNRAVAASLLGVGRTTLYRRMKVLRCQQMDEKQLA